MPGDLCESAAPVRAVVMLPRARNNRVGEESIVLFIGIDWSN